MSSEDAFGLDDLFVEAFDREGRSLGAFSLANVALTDEPDLNTASLTAFQDAGAIGRKFLVRIDENQIANAYVDERGGTFEIYKLSFFMPRAIAGKEGGRRIVATPTGYGVKNAALDHFAASFDSSSDADDDNSHAHYNGASNVFTLDLVDDDEGDANYRRIVTNSGIELLTDAVPIDRIYRFCSCRASRGRCCHPSSGSDGFPTDCNGSLQRSDYPHGRTERWSHHGSD